MIITEGRVQAMQWQRMTVSETLRTLGVSAEKGLSEAEAAKRLQKNGANRLRETGKKSLFRRFLGQFRDFMVIILLIAAAISFATAFLEENGDLADPIIILGIVILNAVIGTVQESKAEKAIESLQKLTSPVSRIRRSGTVCPIPSENVVCGDILWLEEGDCIPADARLIQSTGLKTEESALTGESVPVEKDARLIFSENEPVGEQRNMVFAGTNVAAGHGWAVITETGMHTQMGRIAALLNDGEAPQTPLQERLAHTGKMLGLVAMSICALIFVLGLLQQSDPLDMFMLAVSLAVAAIPEGLPAVVTIVLALGVRRMAAKRAVIRRLPAVETLGCATVICSDKTGTLTQNKMTVTHVADAFDEVDAASEMGRAILRGASLCNNARWTPKNGAEGDPTEKALLIAAETAGEHRSAMERNYPRMGELPFDSERKRMTTLHRSAGRYLVITKGAPEIVLALCDTCRSGGQVQTLTTEARKRIQNQIRALSAQALRVIAVATKESVSLPDEAQWEQKLCFEGMLGMIDPPRPSVREAVNRCRKAGIRPVMITGDHADTAAAIGTQLGILRPGEQVCTGARLDALSDSELIGEASKYTVYARVSPEHKVRIVRALQSRGEVVAMTGDGVNDAPALKGADIGCAMGQSGTDVAKSAADMILTDDHFATIVSAVAEGRGIYANIRKAVHFLLSCNMGEIMTVLGAFLLKLPAPLLAIQLLWVNLVTDSLPALALGVEPAERNIMHHKPIHRRQSLFAGGLWGKIIAEGLLIGTLSLLAYIIGRSFFDVTPSEPIIGRTMAFGVLSLSQLLHAFGMRSERPLFEIGIASNRKMIGAFLIGLLMQASVMCVPLLTSVFRTVLLTPVQWMLVLLLSAIPLFAVELEKKRSRHPE